MLHEILFAANDAIYAQSAKTLALDRISLTQG
jgi:hypothetical protein